MAEISFDADIKAVLIKQMRFKNFLAERLLYLQLYCVTLTMNLGDKDLLSRGVSFLTYLAKLSFISVRTNTAVTMTSKPCLTCRVTNTRIALTGILKCKR